MCFNVEFQSSHLACRAYPRHLVNSQLFVVCPKRIEARKQACIAAEAALRDAIWSDDEGATYSSIDDVERLGGASDLAAGYEILAQSQSPTSAFLNEDWDYVNNCPAATCDEQICEYIGPTRSLEADGPCPQCNGWKKWETVTHVVTAPEGMLDPLMNALMALKWPGDPGYGVPEREGSENEPSGNQHGPQPQGLQSEDHQSETEPFEDEQPTGEQSEGGVSADGPFWEFGDDYDSGWLF
ncbi:hypothetical protein BJX62DRAFT_240614 [Aspergillus germanicus]